jgi:hypothetical protein
VVLVAFVATRLTRYRSAARECAHVLMHLSAAAGTLRLARAA